MSVKPIKDFRFPIVIKLVIITALVLLCAAVPIAFQSAKLFEQYLGEREQDGNRAQARGRANEVENLLNAYIEKARVVASLMTNEYASSKDRERSLWLSFGQDHDLVSVEILKKDPKTGAVVSVGREVNTSYLKRYGLGRNYIEILRETKPISLEPSFHGDIEIRNSSFEGGAPLLTIAFPLSQDELQNVTHIALTDVRLDKIQSAFAHTTEREAYLVDSLGVILAHSNESLAISAPDWSDVPIVQHALRQQTRQGDRRFDNPHKGNQSYLGSFARTSLGPIVISQAPMEVILSPARVVQREAFYYTGLVFSTALFFVFIFSMTLTNPIETLLALAHQVAKGDFDINAKKKIRSRDEVGELAFAFDDMTLGLKEREKAKSLLSKFHGSGIAEDILNREIELGGERKDVVVFFSDIRDFTAFSEGQSPEEVVDMLNEYFDVMVRIITESGGVVDKFIGDAIMAVWGAPKSNPNDVENALMACLKMRESLAGLNERRMQRGKIAIKIGMALHKGEAISGTIGSNERMEYTVIGDTVNTAARLEASTKAFGTDLLVSNEIIDQVGRRFIYELAGSAEVKGKSQALKMFKVRGFINETGREVIVETLYSQFNPEDADKVKVSA